MSPCRYFVPLCSCFITVVILRVCGHFQVALHVSVAVLCHFVRLCSLFVIILCHFAVADNMKLHFVVDLYLKLQGDTLKHCSTVPPVVKNSTGYL